MEGLPEGIDSKFRYVLLVAKRAEQLVQGSHAKEQKQTRQTTAWRWKRSKRTR